MDRLEPGNAVSQAPKKRRRTRSNKRKAQSQPNPQSDPDNDDDPDDHSDDSDPDGNDGGRPGSYYFIYDQADKLSLRRHNVDTVIPIKKIQKNEISKETYDRFVCPNKALRSNFIVTKLQQNNIGSKIHSAPGNFRWIKLDMEYTMKTKPAQKFLTAMEAVEPTTTLLLLLVNYNNKWIPSGMAICVCKVHTTAFRTWKLGNYGRTSNVFDGVELSGHLEKHTELFLKAQSLDTRITNAVALMASMLKVPLRHFQSKQMRVFVDLIGKVARYDTNFMETYDKLTYRKKISAKIDSLALGVQEVS